MPLGKYFFMEMEFSGGIGAPRVGTSTQLELFPPLCDGGFSSQSEACPGLSAVNLPVQDASRGGKVPNPVREEAAQLRLLVNMSRRMGKNNGKEKM